MVAGSENEQRHQNDNRASHASPPCMKNRRLITSLPRRSEKSRIALMRYEGARDEEESQSNHEPSASHKTSARSSPHLCVRSTPHGGAVIMLSLSRPAAIS